MREDSSDDGVNERRPKQISGNYPGGAENMQRSRSGQIPEDHRERPKGHHRIQETQSDRQDSNSRCAGIDKFLHVLCDALIRIVGSVAAQLHPIMLCAGKPPLQRSRREPAPPADLQPLIEIELINGEHDVDCREDAKVSELIDELVPVLVLQRIIKGVVPRIEKNVNSHDRQFDSDHRGEENSPCPTILGKEIGAGNSPHDAKRREYAFHGRSPVRTECRGGWASTFYLWLVPPGF